MKNPIPLIFIFLLFLSLALIFLFTISNPVSPKINATNTKVCQNGETVECTVSSCTGVSTCHNAKWSMCIWDRICDPGSRVACAESGCSKGFKECNSCGTGYGECR
ncbi:hypothetical protein KKE92_04625 [Candidatus Micrarchaeota archaeon]|nr:hypothetical protein [Candidatus Micrarchaeota archaeon]MBU1681747.1 hypothetical protein [Candidatus Micrarchaeota archaeon]